MRNVDILRMRGFSQSLVQKILQVNACLSDIESNSKKLTKITKETLVFKSYEDQPTDITGEEMKDLS